MLRGAGSEVSLVLAHHHGHDHDDQDGRGQTAEDDPDVPGRGVWSTSAVAEPSLQLGGLTLLVNMLHTDKVGKLHTVG